MNEKIDEFEGSHQMSMQGLIDISKGNVDCLQLLGQFGNA